MATDVTPGTRPHTRRGRYENRLSNLETIFSSWKAHLREIAKYLMPRRVRFDKSDHNRGGRRNDDIFNPRPRRAHRVMASGMHAGITSPARPWFKFIFDDLQLMEREDVKRWLADVEEVVRTALVRSNAYNALPTCYEDLGAWGTTATFIEPDPKDVMRFDNQPMGTYHIALDENKRPRTIFRQMELSVEQMVKRFGKENCSTEVQTLWENNKPDETFTVVHVVEPGQVARQVWDMASGRVRCSLRVARRTGRREHHAARRFLPGAVCGRWRPRCLSDRSSSLPT